MLCLMKMFQAGNIREIVQHCMAQQRLADLDFLADAETLGKFLDFFVKNSVTALDYFLGKFFQKSVVVCVYFFYCIHFSSPGRFRIS